MPRSWAHYGLALWLLGCPKRAPEGVEPTPLPASLADHVQVLPETDPDFPHAALESAENPAGEGGVSMGLAVRIVTDIPVYRMWNGPDKLDEGGHTNRLGGWWAADPPKGTVDRYRRDYAVCQEWNDLTWVATCTLKAGAVVVVGPGQSVSGETCGSQAEAYPENPRAWQIYIEEAWARSSELVCPMEKEDYEADPANVSKPR